MEMRKFLVPIAVIGLCSCQSSDRVSDAMSDVVETIEAVEVTPLTARDYVEQNLYLDFDVDSLTAARYNIVTDATVTGPKGQFRALMYRMGRKTHLDSDSVRVVDITSAEDINASERVYEWLKNHNDFSGDIARKRRSEWKARGMKVISQELNEAYFEWLLDPSVNQLERMRAGR